MRLTIENTAIVLDSTSDLPRPEERAPNWRVVPLYVHFGDRLLRDYIDISPEEFYARLRASETQPRTSQPSPGDFSETFDTLAGYDRILAVLISSKLSGTYTSARLASDLAADRVLVIDSGAVSGGIVLLADALQRRLQRGTTEEEVLACVERYRKEARFVFTLATVEYLVRGGRVGKAAGLASQLVSVKPILEIADGEVVPAGRARGRKGSIRVLLRRFESSTDDDSRLHVGVVHSESRAEAEELAARLRVLRPRASFDLLTSFGPVLGTNSGPGGLGIFWFAD